MRPPLRRRLGGALHLRVGLLVRRDPRLWWLLVLTVAVAAGWVASAVVARAERARVTWGTSELVLVATHDLAPGDELRSGDTTLVARPRAILPASALRELPDRAIVRELVLAGEVVVAERLAPQGLTAVAARLPTGTSAVAIPIEPGLAPPLTLGDHVDVIIALPPESAGSGPPGFAIATDALVVALDDSAVTVAVARDAAPRIAVALSQGAVTLALVGA